MVLGFLFGKKKAQDRRVAGILKPYDAKKVKEEWERIDQLISTNRPSAYKEAVISADKLLDYALKQVSFGGTAGERLKNASSAFSKDVYQGLWDAHKMRNALVHEAGFDLTVLVAREVLAKFRRGFESLGVNL